MLEEREAKKFNFNLTLMMRLMIRLLGILFHLALVMGTLTITVWLIHQFISLTTFEASVLSIGIWGLVLLVAIYGKMNSIEQTIAQEDWDEEYEFYNEEEEDEIFQPEEWMDTQNNATRGNVIHLKQKIFSEKQDKN